jgi:predicted type IV restriction endonuclease
VALVNDLRTAVTAALSAGVAAARGQGTALKADFEALIKPNLDAIVVQVAAIGEDLVAGNIGAAQARDDLHTQLDAVTPLILAEAELTLLAAQVIINAVMNALKSVINAASTRAIGVALL